MSKKKPVTKKEIFNLSSDVFPLAEFADVVKVSYQKSNSIILLTFGQSHPDRNENTLTREIVLPESVCLQLNQILSEYFEKEK